MPPRSLQAEYREEKRWMQRQIQRQKTKLKNKENARISKLVNRAYACDPRVITAKAVEKAKKEREKQARQEAKRLREEEAARKLQEAEAAKKAAEETKVAEVRILGGRTGSGCGEVCRVNFAL
jgi:hypothetical protein